MPKEDMVHIMPLRVDAIMVTQRPYRTNLNIVQSIHDELKKLLDVGFIYEIEHPEWVSPIVCVPKKNGKLMVCVDFNKLNAFTIKDHYPLSYT